MAAPPAPVARPGVLTVAQLKPAGLRHDARLQDVLHKFCVTCDEPASIRAWHVPEEPRPLWQLGVVAMALNGGIVMMTDGGDHDALHMACEADLLSALTGPAAPVPAAPAAPAPAAPLATAVTSDARTPYEYETDGEADGTSSFERELEGLSLMTECAGR